MRYARIFFLHFQEAIEFRSVSFVWFLLALLNPLLYLLFWRGAITENSVFGVTLSLPEIASYYILLIVAGAFLVVHIEETVAYWDIQEGGLVKYLVKPFSYFWFKFNQELPYRIIQGAFGLIPVLIIAVFFGNILHITSDPPSIFMALIISIMAFFVSFVFKMVVGLSAFWLTDYSGLQQLIFVSMFIFAGFIIPLEYFSPLLKSIAYALPFSYIIYFPVIAFQGKLTLFESFRVLMTQGMWLFVLSTVYVSMWKNGIKKFVGVGH